MLFTCGGLWPIPAGFWRWVNGVGFVLVIYSGGLFYEACQGPAPWLLDDFGPPATSAQPLSPTPIVASGQMAQTYALPFFQTFGSGQ